MVWKTCPSIYYTRVNTTNYLLLWLKLMIEKTMRSSLLSNLDQTRMQQNLTVETLYVGVTRFGLVVMSGKVNVCLCMGFWWFYIVLYGFTDFVCESPKWLIIRREYGTVIMWKYVGVIAFFLNPISVPVWLRSLCWFVKITSCGDGFFPCCMCFLVVIDLGGPPD